VQPITGILENFGLGFYSCTVGDCHDSKTQLQAAGYDGSIKTLSPDLALTKEDYAMGKKFYDTEKGTLVLRSLLRHEWEYQTSPKSKSRVMVRLDWDNHGAPIYKPFREAYPEFPTYEKKMIRRFKLELRKEND
jgi:hypothetical protein